MNNSPTKQLNLKATVSCWQNINDILPEAFAVVREAAKRKLRPTPF